MDADLYLYAANGTQLGYSSLDIGTEEVIRSNLTAGGYYVRFHFFGARVGVYQPTECDTLTVEIEIAPLSVITQRTQSVCPAQEQFPNLDFSVLTTSSNHYYYSTTTNTSGTVYNVRGPSTSNKYDTRWAKSYQINVPTSSAGKVWTIEVILGTEFVLGDSLGLLLTRNTNASELDVTCYSDNSGICTIGVNTRMNENTLKAALEPAPYVLWIYDMTGEKDTSLSSCIPFSLTVKLEAETVEETFYNCDAPTLPDVLLPGYDEPQGVVHYLDSPLLDLSEGTHNIHFTLNQSSLFRVYTQPHRVDIDLKLLNANDGSTLEYVFRIGGEESIAKYLSTGNYTLQIIYYGVYEPIFCETFDLEIAIAPSKYYSNTSYCMVPGTSTVKSMAPDFSTMQAYLDAVNHTFYMNSSVTYYFDYQNSYSERPIIAQNFTLVTRSALKASLGDNFLTSDLQIEIRDDTGRQIINGTHARNYDRIEATLEPGQYIFVVSTSPVQKSQIAGLPPCAEYTLFLSIMPDTSAPTCWQYWRMPSSLNIVPYLGHNNFIHFVGDYLVPTFSSGSVSVSTRTNFTVTEPTFLRIWIEPHEVDIDIYLYQDGTRVASTILVNVEEEIVYQVLPNKFYQIGYTYYKPRNYDSRKCYVFRSEIALTLLPATVPTCSNRLPPSTLIPNYTPTEANPGQPFYSSGTWLYNQTASNFNLSFPFTITASVNFRSYVLYDFAWADLSVRIRNANSSATLIFGEDDYDKNELGPVELSPGSYVLEIYEPAAVSAPQYRGCVDFTLAVGYEGVNAQQLPEEFDCNAAFFPVTMNNNPAFLNAITGNKVHWRRNVLANVETRKDNTAFTITDTSILTIFVPYHDAIDVDFTLRTTLYPNGTVVDRKNGLVEEAMYVVLTPGTYNLEFKYYPVHGSLPSASSCPTFSMEFSLVPQTYYTSVQAVSQTCTSTTLPPTSLVRATDYGATFHRVPNAVFSSSMNFQVESRSSLLFDLRYQHQVGGLSLQMIGQVDVGGSTPQTRTYHANVGINHAFLYYILEAGSYTVTFFNPYNVTGTAPPFQCSDYRVEYRLDYTNITDSSCENTDPLPTDLYTDAGGSAAFGGPQDPDGSVRIWGDDFKLDEDHRHSYIDYVINSPSYIRVFAQSSEDADIDFYFYTNSNRTSLVDLSLGVDSVESNLLALNSSSLPYELDVYLYDLDTDQLCPTFEFELAIKTQATVQSELQCPLIMPSPEVPPSYFNLASDVDLSAEYIFTKSRVDANTVNHIFTYRMTLNVPFNGTVVMASVGYDFIANDFRLALSDDDGNTMLWGSLGGIQNRDDYYNFYSMLYVSLATGTYYLDIVEDMSDKPFNFTQYCHRFDFVLSTFSGHNVTTQPYIDQVVPPGGDGVTYDPYRDLTIRVSFSESVVLPADQTVLNYITSRSAAYLYPANNASNHIFPGAASFSNSNTRLTVTFRKPFSVGQRYIFVVDGSKFQASSGLTYVSPTQEFSYQMRTCDCNGHGTCNTSATSQLTCNCDAGYASLDCSQCASGYHGVGAVCVANTKCTNTTCNGHGTCSDSTGSPICVCDTGYATTGDAYCTICAPGYSTYPNCTISDANERNTVCSAPLFPQSLDTVEFLGYDGEVHLSDSYYIDLDNYRTEIYFSLQQNSVFRVYVEPHWIDVDLWLYALKDDGSIDRYIENEVAYNTEEVIYRTLDGQSGAHPKKYMLRLRYFVWDRTRSPDCESINFELAIEPTTKAQNDPNQRSCSSMSMLPPSNNQTHFQGIHSDVHYSYPNTFSVRNNNATGEAPNYFYVYNFEIDPPEGKVAILHAEVGYRFLTGDLALLLEVGDGLTHCGNSGGYSSDCVQGANTYNLNSLDEILMGGKYSLWIYEPQPQLPLTNCSVFNYDFKITFVDAINDLYYCDAVLLPDSFNLPGYLDNSGNMHIYNNFLIEDVAVSFTLTTSSYIRVAGDSENSVRFAIYRGSTLVIQSDLSNNPEIFISLASGSYQFKMISYQVSEEYCPIVTTQITIMPQSSVAHSCPPTELLPNPFPSQSISLDEPYEFDETSNSNPVPTPFYASTNNLIIKTTTFTLSETGFFDAYLSSDFISANLKFSLSFSGSGGETVNVNGSLGYNQYYIKQMLQAGTYTFKIFRSSTAVPSGFPPCSEFNLRITIKSQADYDTNTCVAAGEPLPTSLNSIRFLGHDGIFDFQQTQIRAPEFNTFYQEVVKFSVTTPSVLRVYSEPHILDVDLILYQEGNSTSLTDGGLGFNNEESIIYQVNPGVNYELTLNYWMWDSNPPDCLYFNLEIAVSPLSQIHLNPTCPNSGSDHWPSLVGKTTTVIMPNSFAYNSAQESLYFQQTTTGTRSSPPITLRILGDDKANVYAEVGYDYISGDLVMKMVNKDTGDVYYGANTFNGNVLSLTNVVQGNYTITIYEVVETLPSIMGCSNFTFQLYVEVAGQENLLGPYPRLPTTLDTISYLKYDNSVYLQGTYRMFETSATETIQFTISTSSLLRVATDHQVNELDDVLITLYTGSTTYAQGSETLLKTLPANSYTLKLTKPNGPAISSLDVDFELEIKTDSQISSYIAAQPTTCNTTRIPEIKLTPDGYLNEFYPDLTITNGDLATLTDLQTLTFTVNVDSVVYFKLGFDYMLSDLSLTLSSLSSSTEIEPVSGKNGRNMNYVNVVIPPGTWSLKMYQPAVFVYSTQYPHCTHYSATMSIEALSDVNDHVDCTTLDILPWDLNSANGGSKPYGGPVNRDGALQMAGSNFYIHHDIDTMYLTPTVDSLLNVITKEKFSGEIAYTVQTNTSTALIETSMLGISNSNQKTALYQLTGKKTYLIMLDYPSVQRINCPSLSLQLSMQPTDLVASTMACPSTFKKPQTNPQIVSGSYSEYVDSAWSRNDITSRIDSVGNFNYYINFTLTTFPAKVYASIGFNGLNSLFTFSLVRWSGNNRFEIARSEANFQRSATGDSTVTQSLTGTITTSGTYSLIIQQPAFIAPFVNGTYCLPFQYELVIVPDTGFPWVKSVSPYAQDGVNPSVGLTVALEMSEAPYAHNNPATTSDFHDAFILKDAASSTTLSPTTVTVDSGSTLYWTLTFTSLKAATTYQLKLAAGSSLQNKNTTSFQLLTTNMYTTVDTTCSNHGTFHSETGQCFCNSGYGGESCETCMPNYQAVTENGTLVCKQKTGELCLIDSCGCLPNHTPCVPLGQCVDSTGTIKCTCPPHYDPATNCMTCLSGYTDYANGCTQPERQCPTCEHGHCDNTTKTCVCDGNYAPPTCSSCLDGWGGSKCSEKTSSGGSSDYSSALEAVRVVEIVLAVLVLVATGGFLLYRRFGPRGYQQVEMEFNAMEQDQESPFELDE